MYLKIFIIYIGILFSVKNFAQSQACPANINFGDGSLTNWSAYTGKYNNDRTNPPPTVTNYPAATNAGVSSINEFYGQNGTGSPPAGITVISTASTDYFGGFPTIPNINGYQYDKSVQLGSTTIWGGSTGAYHGLFRGVSYTITVPPGSATDPYTMTYAYAMVLEDGSHANDQQPLAKATLTKPDGTIIDCASPSYYLPTYGSNNTLDTTAAKQQGFSRSSHPTPNTGISGSLYRVWYKPWTEVTFNLSAYRGQQVTLTFEADNCVPGGHFAYAYFAIRNECNGLQITGPQIACTNSSATYTIPALPGSTSFNWKPYPAGWTILLDSANYLKATPNNQSGTIQVTQSNSCDTLTSTLNVNVKAPTIAGSVVGSDSVCTGTNSTVLSVTGNTGNILNWLFSTDSINWNLITDTLATYTANNLTQTTRYRAIIQNGSACAIDTSGLAVIGVSSKSIAGTISPDILNLCTGQNQSNVLYLQGYSGNIVNWLYSYDTLHWIPESPGNTDTLQPANSINVPTQYRVVVKNSVCPADTSNIAYTAIYNTPYPKATILPADTTICYGDTANLDINITTGTSYKWVNSISLIDNGDGTIPPNNFNVTVFPLQTFSYVAQFMNAGCPQPLLDTVTVNVIPKINLSAGNDTVVVVNQPLQLIAATKDTANLNYIWTPSTGLNNPLIYNPIAILQGSNGDTIVYAVKASDYLGCFATDSIKVAIFKTLPDIFVPSAFTPNGEGKNDILKAIPIGIKTFEYFNIYNRYGQLLFTTPDPERGWDGNLNGYKQPSGTYVYMARGISYQNRIVFRKGTVVLIR